jgi:hypothetical protein
MNKKIIIFGFFLVFFSIFVSANNMWNGVDWSFSFHQNTTLFNNSEYVFNNVNTVNAHAKLGNYIGYCGGYWGSRLYQVNITSTVCNGTNIMKDYSFQPFIAIPDHNNPLDGKRGLIECGANSGGSTTCIGSTCVYNFQGICCINETGYNSTSYPHELVLWYQSLSLNNYTIFDRNVNYPYKPITGWGATTWGGITNVNRVENTYVNTESCVSTSTTTTTTLPPILSSLTINDTQPVLKYFNISFTSITKTYPLDKTWYIVDNIQKQIKNSVNGSDSFIGYGGDYSQGFHSLIVYLNDSNGNYANAAIVFEINTTTVTTTTTLFPSSTTTTLLEPYNITACFNVTAKNGSIVSYPNMLFWDMTIDDYYVLFGDSLGNIRTPLFYNHLYHVSTISNSGFEDSNLISEYGSNLNSPSCYNFNLTSLGNGSITTTTTNTVTTITTTTNPNNPKVTVHFYTQTDLGLGQYVLVPNVQITLFCDTGTKTGITDNTGHYNFNNIPFYSQCDYDANDPNLPTTLQNFNSIQGITIDDLQENPINVVLTLNQNKPCSFNGFIKFSNGTIIPGADIDLYYSSNSFSDSFKSDANGFYNINTKCNDDFYITSIVNGTTLRKDFHIGEGIGSHTDNVNLVYQISQTNSTISNIWNLIVAIFMGLFSVIMIIGILFVVLVLLLVIKAIQKAAS